MQFANNSARIFNQKQYLSDGGLETTLIFHKGIMLKHFAAFELLRNEEGKKVLEEYYRSYLLLAEKYRLGLLMNTPTWRAGCDWGFKLGYTHDELFALNKQSIKFLRELARPFSQSLPQIVVSGTIGPRGDGYKPGMQMNAEQAKVYHLEQIKAFALADADLLTAYTITYSDEAIGIVNAANTFNMPVAISFTVDTNGNLPSGESLQQVIEQVDSATDYYAEHFMINCAHPQHFMHRFKNDDHWKMRIRGIKANASLKSHEELDGSDTIDEGDKILFADGYGKLNQMLPYLKVIGGCCGTNASHIEEICRTLNIYAGAEHL